MCLYKDNNYITGISYQTYPLNLVWFVRYCCFLSVFSILFITASNVLYAGRVLYRTVYKFMLLTY